MKKLVLGPLIMLGLLVAYILFEVQVVTFLLNNMNNGTVASYGMWRLRLLERKDKILGALRSPVPKTRLFAVWTCQSEKWPEAIPAIADCLATTDDELLAAANEAVLAFRDPMFILPLKKNTERFASLEQIKKQIVTVESLAQIPSDEAAIIVTKLLKNMGNYKWRDLRIACERALAHLGRPMSKAFFLDQVKRGSDPAILRDSARALKALGVVEASPLLARCADRSMDEGVKLACLDALSTLGTPAEVPTLRKVAKKGTKKVREAANKLVKELSL